MQERILSGLAQLLTKQSGSISRLMAQWDTDHNGAISRSEWHTRAMPAIGLDGDDPEMTALRASNMIFDAFDTNGSGQIEFIELQALLTKINEQGIRAVRSTDVTHGGVEYVELGDVLSRVAPSAASPVVAAPAPAVVAATAATATAAAPAAKGKKPKKRVRLLTKVEARAAAARAGRLVKTAREDAGL